MPKTERVPDALKSKFEAICERTDAFCAEYLDAECAQVVRLVVAALARKRPSPLLAGREETWAAGAVHAVAMTNFLFDKSQPVHCASPDIGAFFGLGASTISTKSKQIRETLKMYPLDHQWALPSQVGTSSLHWMIQVNGLIVDARQLPREIQQIAVDKGLIPYLPDEHNEYDQ